MKWVVFILGVLAAYPAGRWLRARPRFRLRAWMLIGFLPFFYPLDMALVFVGSQLSDTHGIEVALIDWLVLTLFFAQQGPSRPLPYRFALGAYLLVAVVSVIQARWTILAVGYVWKLCRMYLLFATVCRAGHDRRVPLALLRGLTFGIVCEGALAVWQHYGLGLFQVTGSFAHQNTLGVLMNLVVMVPIALVFAGPTTLLTRLAVIAAVPAGLFTLSRGTLLFLGAGSALVFLGSVFRRYTRRKARIALIGLVVGAAIVPLALTMLESRTAEERARSMRGRDQLESAALLMMLDHPLGIGPSNFTAEINIGRYGERAGVHWILRSAIVHNIYALTAAELGYAGVVALLVLFLAPLLSAFRHGLQARRDRRGDVLLGLGVGLTVFYAHSFFEWIWRATEVQYVFWMVVAVVAVLARAIREGRPARPAVRTAAPAVASSGRLGNAEGWSAPLQGGNR
jgi:O-antigen ligase